MFDILIIELNEKLNHKEGDQDHESIISEAQTSHHTRTSVCNNRIVAENRLEDWEQRMAKNKLFHKMYHCL